MIVAGPTVAVTGPNMGIVRAGPDGANAAYWMLQLADTNLQNPLGVNQEGITITFQVNGQSLAGTDVTNGTVAVLQLVSAARWLQDSGDNFWAWSLNGMLVLDRLKFPTGWSNSPFDLTQPITPTSVATLNFFDAPAFDN